MGGFVSRSTQKPIYTKEHLELPGILEDIKAIKLKVIQDKSKGDAFSKSIALGQILWFIIQGAARLQQHLSITELDIITLAFSVVNLFIWYLWWNKPLNVEQLIEIGPFEFQVEQETIEVVELYSPQPELSTGLNW
uniref:Uncharacterized protein n=1 Tax=Mycena chlorophos TaxID=658473 RepID=A0ABQ0L0U8_MYCCL|nr:predicted protein [Mycena chlorophos]